MVSIHLKKIQAEILTKAVNSVEINEKRNLFLFSSTNPKTGTYQLPSSYEGWG